MELHHRGEDISAPTLPAVPANPPGALAAAKRPPGKEAVGEDSSVIAWLADAALGSAGLLGELAAGAAAGRGLEAGLAAAGVAGMSYFCTCSR